jgi:serine/threonine protein kinase
LFRTELFNNIQRGVLKLPVSMSLEAKNLIVHLLNRNPSRRLGAGPEGAEEIKRHQFFADIDWNAVRERQLPVPKPKASV